MKRSTKKYGRQTITNSLMPDMTISSVSRGCSNLYCDHVNCTAAPFSMKVNPLTGDIDYKTESSEMDSHLAVMKKAMAKNPILCLELAQRASAVDDERNAIKAKLATSFGATKECLIGELSQKDAEFSEWTAKIFALAGNAAPKARSLPCSVAKTVPTKKETAATARGNDIAAERAPFAKCRGTEAERAEADLVVTELESKLKALQEREKRLVAEVHLNNNSLKEANAALDTTAKALRTSKDEHKKEIQKMSGAEDVKAFKKMEAELHALQVENRHLSEERHKAALSEQKLLRNMNDLQAELNKGNKAHAYAEGVINSLQEKNNALMAENAELKGKVREAEQADKRAKKEQSKHGKANKALGPQLEAAKEECRQLRAALDEAKAARLRLTDELTESQRRTSEQQGALKLLERDGRRAQQELEKHRKTSGRLTEECNSKQRCIESMSARINEILDASRQATRSGTAPASSDALQELVRERQRADQLERLLQSALNDGARKDEIIEELSNQPACLICDDKRSEQTFMVRDANGPSGLDVCGHLYCTDCLDQGAFCACPVCKQPIVKRVTVLTAQNNRLA